VFRPTDKASILEAAARAQATIDQLAADLKSLTDAINTARHDLWRKHGHSGAHLVFVINSQLPRDVRSAMKFAGLERLPGIEEKFIVENQPAADLVSALKARGLGPRTPAPPKVEVGRPMRVEAIARGEFEAILRKPGDMFTVNESQFSSKWMREVLDEPESQIGGSR
jgi:hypothetical protein